MSDHITSLTSSRLIDSQQTVSSSPADGACVAEALEAGTLGAKAEVATWRDGVRSAPFEADAADSVIRRLRPPF